MNNEKTGWHESSTRETQSLTSPMLCWKVSTQEAKNVALQGIRFYIVAKVGICATELMECWEVYTQHLNGTPHTNNKLQRMRKFFIHSVIWNSNLEHCTKQTSANLWKFRPKWYFSSQCCGNVVRWNALKISRADINCIRDFVITRWPIFSYNFSMCTASVCKVTF